MFILKARSNSGHQSPQNRGCCEHPKKKSRSTTKEWPENYREVGEQLQTGTLCEGREVQSGASSSSRTESRV